MWSCEIIHNWFCCAGVFTVHLCAVCRCQTYHRRHGGALCVVDVRGGVCRCVWWCGTLGGVVVCRSPTIRDMVVYGGLLVDVCGDVVHWGVCSGVVDVCCVYGRCVWWCGTLVCVCVWCAGRPPSGTWWFAAWLRWSTRRHQTFAPGGRTSSLSSTSQPPTMTSRR